MHPLTKPVLASALALAATAAASPHAQAVVVRHDRPVADYNTAASAAAFAGSAFFGYAGDATNFCSGTLVAPNKIITAAHCVDFDGDGVLDDPASSLGVGFGANFSQLAQNVQSIAVHPQWAANGTHDVAVLTLSQPINNITPALVYDGDPTGLLAAYVGYGGQSDGNSDNLTGANDRLGGFNIIDAFDNFDDTLFLTDFDHPNGSTSSMGSSTPLDLEATSAPGDSGGSVYAQVNGTWALVGAVSGGNAPFEYGDIATNTWLGHADIAPFLRANGVTVGPVPEPASAALLTLAAVGTLTRRRRR